MAYLIIFLIILIIYFIPSWNAYKNKSASFNQILVLNIFLGWTLIGWVGALIWSMQKKTTILSQPNISPRASPQYGASPQYKVCPFCAESILLKANKCRFCGEFLVEEKVEKSTEIILEKKESFEDRMVKIDGLIENLKKHQR